MEPEGSLPHSQVPATCPYPDLCFRILKIISELAWIFHLIAVELNLEELQNESFVFLRIFVRKTKYYGDCINSSKRF